MRCYAKKFSGFTASFPTDKSEKTTESKIIPIRLSYKMLVSIECRHTETTFIQYEANMAKARKAHYACIGAWQANLNVRCIILNKTLFCSSYTQLIVTTERVIPDSIALQPAYYPLKLINRF